MKNIRRISSWRGAPFALLHVHRTVRGVCQGFLDGAPKRRVLDRLPGLFNAAEMRAKGACEAGGDLPKELRGPRRGRKTRADFDLLKPVQNCNLDPRRILAYCR